MNNHFTTMVELGSKDTEKCDKSVKSFTMDEAFLNDLLECSVCLEQLDSTSKVLPCQHTFCKRCLQEIVNSHKELRCPECRILVDSKIEELPCNILLVRLLEGIKNNVRPKRVGSGVEVNARNAAESSGQLQTPPHPQLPQPLGNLPRTPSSTDLRMVSKQVKVLQACPCAKALYPYEAKVPGDLTFKKGDVIILRKRVDQNWFYGELGGKSGFVPASFVQVVVPIPSHVPQCKALYDFQISSSEEKDCLTFGKGDILTVIRRIDDHWAEGKLRDRIGIFPISFVEMNAAARAVMKLSSNAQLSSRILPPVAPTTDSHFGTTTTTSVANAAQSPQYQEPTSSTNPQQPASSGTNTPFSPSAFTSPIHTSQPAQQSASLAAYPGTSYEGLAGGTSHHRQVSAAGAKASDEQQIASEGGHEGPAVVSKSRSTPSPAFTSVASVTPPLVTQRAESISGGQTPTQSGQEDSPGGASPLSSGDITKSSHAPARSTSQAPTHVPVPTFYLALYTYRPLKEDELELRKGELYTVSEKCQDGWFKGTSLRTGLSGVFPGNYVQIAKSAVLQPHIGVSIAGRTSPATSTTSPPPSSGAQPHQRTTFSGITTTTENPHLFHPISTQGVIYTNSPITLCGRVPATSTSPVSPAHPAVLEWAHSIAVAAPLQRIQRPVSSVGAFSPALYKSEIGSKQNGFPCGQSRSLAMAPWTSLCAIDFNSAPSSSSQVVTDFPIRTTSASPTRMLSYQASPNTNVSNSGGGDSVPSQPRYSISQPSTPLMMPHTVPPNTNPFVTDRLGPPATSGVGCTMAGQASSSQARVEKHKEKKEKEIVSLMKRLTKRKSKSPPPSDYSCDNPSFVDGTSSQQSLSAVHVRSTSCPSEALGSQVNHKKTGSLDGSNGEVPKTSSRPKQPAPLVRERFRCIVPYPPNSDYELELKVGDVVYVHKKREDGWYKGTLQRTGKTGLFPSSFVEGF